jgi:RNA polymerase sigma factor (sigma-70 family)
MQPKQGAEDNEIATTAIDTALYDRYAHVIFAYIQLHLSSREDAEDVLLEVFTAAMERHNLSGLDEQEQLKWLRRVAKNTLVDIYRRTHRHPAVSLEAVAEILYEDELRSPEHLALRQEDYQQLHALIRTLSPLQQQLLQLRFGYDLAFAEIAILLDKREDALRKTLSRTLVFLRKAYALQP